jgi:hypothetical protein
MPNHIVFCREEACLGTGAIGALGHGVNHGIFVGFMPTYVRGLASGRANL